MNDKWKQVNPVEAEEFAIYAYNRIKEAKDVEPELKAVVQKALRDMQRAINLLKHVAVAMEDNLTCDTCILKGHCLSKEFGKLRGGCIADFTMRCQDGVFDVLFESCMHDVDYKNVAKGEEQCK